MQIEIVHTPNPLPIPAIATRFVEEALLPSLSGTHVNKPIAVLLGGSHAKQLSNSRSDVDLTLYYTTSVKNLLSFRRETLNIVPKGFKQVELASTSSVFYEWEDTKFEIAVEPVRRVGRGSDLLGSLHGCNMKVLHDLTFQYPIWEDALYWGPVMDMIFDPRFDWSLDAAVGYFSGYMQSQLLSHKRKLDWESRETKALTENNVTPVVKHAVSGLYIGLSGLLLLDKLQVSRDFWKMWKIYAPSFSDEEQKFVEACWLHKTDQQHIVANVGYWVAHAGKMRESLFMKMKKMFEDSKQSAVYEGRFPEQVNRKVNAKLLDELQDKVLI